MFKALCLLSARLKRVFNFARHVLLRGRDIDVNACRDGGKNRRTQRAALIGGDNLQRTIQDVAAGLHDHLIFTGDTAQRHHLVYGDTLFGEALHNRARTKRGRRNQAAKQRRRIGCQVEIRDHPFKALVGKRGTATVEPVEHHREMIKRRIFCPRLGELREQHFFAGINVRFQLRMRRGQLIQRPAQHTSKPGVDIAKGGLPGFETDKIRDNAPVNLATNAFHRAVTHGSFIGGQNVAG
ncbi:hypothetical protein D3C80_1353160 [compost metagenome]